ncbi:MAG: cobalamin-binding protein [Candidatus Bathyarchaeia archaeon]|jgi:iron complex transport system substrate-binding protein
MKNKYVIYIATIIAIASIASAAFIYVSYSAQNATLRSQNSNITLVDDEGYVTTLTSIPQRIVSLAPSCTQILFAIGVGDKVVGVTTYDDYPYNFSAWVAAGNMTYDGGYGTPNMEAIASLHPDLILSDNLNDASLPSMRALGYKVLVLNPATIAGIYQDIALVGRATGAETQATAVIENITSSINAITAKIAAANITVPQTVYYEIWSNPLMSAGSTTWINNVITDAGGVNIFENVSTQYPVISSETVVSLDPDVIILPTEMGVTPFYGSVAQVEATPGWNVISAVQNNRVYVINGDVFAEPGPRVADQVYTVAACLYPQLFNSTS